MNLSKFRNNKIKPLQFLFIFFFYQEKNDCFVFSLSAFPSSPSYFAGTCELWQCFASFRGASHIEWLSVYTQLVYKRCSHWNQRLTASRWDETRHVMAACHFGGWGSASSLYSVNISFGKKSNVFIPAETRYNEEDEKYWWLLLLGLEGYFQDDSLRTFLFLLRWSNSSIVSWFLLCDIYH